MDFQINFRQVDRFRIVINPLIHSHNYHIRFLEKFGKPGIVRGFYNSGNVMEKLRILIHLHFFTSFNIFFLLI